MNESESLAFLSMLCCNVTLTPQKKESKPKTEEGQSEIETSENPPD